MGEEITSKINVPPTSSLNVYEEGAIKGITINELMNNRVGITQLVNNNNSTEKELHSLQQKFNSLLSDIKHLKTTPFIAVFSLIVNAIGTAILAIISKETENSSFYNWFLVFGICLIMIGSLINILYPYAKKWFNDEK